VNSIGICMTGAFPVLYGECEFSQLLQPQSVLAERLRSLLQPTHTGVVRAQQKTRGQEVLLEVSGKVHDG